jgi:teichuronic acid biosynthesis glycosyltransferase TuaH
MTLTAERLPDGSPTPSGWDVADVVFTFSWVTWESAQQRGMNMPEDRLLDTLLDHPGIRRLLVANTARSLPVKLARDLARPGRSGFPATPDRRLVQPLRLRRADPVRPDAARRWVATYERCLRRHAARLGLERPAIVTFHPLVAGFGDFAWAGPVTYYGIDQWSAHPAKQPWRAVFDAAHEGMRRRGVRVCAVSPAIVEEIAPTGPSLVAPNGVEPSEWLEPGPPPAWLRDRPGPHLLYTGSLDGRLDERWMAALAAAMPEARVHLVGRVMDAPHIDRLLRHPIVELHANVGRSEVAAIVAGCDAGLLAHVESPLTSAMSPLKVYEYLAAGLPVAATALPPVVGIDPRVVLVEPGGDAVGATRRALALGRAPEAERRRFIRDHAWSRRHEDILAFALAR